MTEEQKEEAENEVKVMSRLVHPHIVTFHKTFERNMKLHIVMEYCQGGDLSQFLEKQNGRVLAESLVWDIFI